MIKMNIIEKWHYHTFIILIIIYFISFFISIIGLKMNIYWLSIPFVLLTIIILILLYIIWSDIDNIIIDEGWK